MDWAVIWKLCETEQAEGCVSALTFANPVYVMRWELDPARIRAVLDKLRLILHFTDFAAAEPGWDDFEGAIRAATAERIMAESIISGNVRDFRNSKVIAFAPAEFIARL